MPNHTILESIGNTPLVRIRDPDLASNVEVYAKLEYMNPSGSVKDRIAKYMIEDAERRGILKPGGTVIEASAGNTGASVAMVAAMRGYKPIIVMFDKVSIEKQDAAKAFGAEIVLTATVTPDSDEYYIHMSHRLAESMPGSFLVGQFENAQNVQAHFETTGPEIWRQTEGKVTHFVCGAGTGGTITGVGRFLKSKNRGVHVVMSDPIGSSYYHYFKTGKLLPKEQYTKYQIEGIGLEIIPKTIDFSIIDDVYQCQDQDAFRTARELASQEGIFGGGSGGANVWAALKLARSLEGPATVVTVIPDSGLRYLSKFYNDDWMLKHGFSL